MEKLISHISHRGAIRSWSKSMRLKIFLVKSGINMIKNSVQIAQRLNNIPFPVGKSTSINKAIIPRYTSLQLKETYRHQIIKGEWVEHKSATVDKVILYAHGGAFVIGSPMTHRGITSQLSKYSKCKVLSLDYRLSPQHFFPAALNDMISAYMYLIDPPVGHERYDPSQVIFAGDSAGGNLALSCSIFLADSEYPVPRCLILLSPWLDLTHSMPSFNLFSKYDILPDSSNDPLYINSQRAHYYTSDNSFLQNPYVSPLFSLADKLPATLIQIGDAERLFDENLVFSMMCDSLQLEIFQDMVHVFQYFNIPFGYYALERIGNFISSPHRSTKALYITPDAKESEVTLSQDLFNKIVLSGRSALIKSGKWSQERQQLFEKITDKLYK